jgi:hypothetical protein
VESSNAQIRRDWANTLHRWGLTNFAATLLEALEPLNLFGAQMVYLTQPVLTTFVPADHLDALADLLEDPQTAQSFITVLRQSDTRKHA